jgi:AcrR family transcriptional regulator
MGTIDPDIYRTLVEASGSARQTQVERRKLQIIEVAIDLFATRGMDQTTYDDISRKCGVSRALVQHYFPKREELFLLAARLIRAEFQRQAVDAIRAETEVSRQLAAYVESTFAWVEGRRKHARLWMLFFYHCAIHARFRKVHSEMTEMGRARVEALLRAGVESGAFRCADPAVAAKSVQGIISGFLVMALTEDSPVPRETLLSEAKAAVARLVG